MYRVLFVLIASVITPAFAQNSALESNLRQCRLESIPHCREVAKFRDQLPESVKIEIREILNRHFQPLIEKCKNGDMSSCIRAETDFPLGPGAKAQIDTARRQGVERNEAQRAAANPAEIRCETFQCLLCWSRGNIRFCVCHFRVRDEEQQTTFESHMSELRAEGKLANERNPDGICPSACEVANDQYHCLCPYIGYAQLSKDTEAKAEELSRLERLKARVPKPQVAVKPSKETKAAIQNSQNDRLLTTFIIIAVPLVLFSFFYYLSTERRRTNPLDFRPPGGRTVYWRSAFRDSLFLIPLGIAALEYVIAFQTPSLADLNTIGGMMLGQSIFWVSLAYWRLYAKHIDPPENKFLSAPEVPPPPSTAPSGTVRVVFGKRQATYQSPKKGPYTMHELLVWINFSEEAYAILRKMEALDGTMYTYPNPPEIMQIMKDAGIPYDPDLSISLRDMLEHQPYLVSRSTPLEVHRDEQAIREGFSNLNTFIDSTRKGIEAPPSSETVDL